MSHLETTAVYHLLRRAIEEKEPFSLVRLGDGEARLIGYPTHVSKSELDMSLRYWYGKMKPTKSQTMQLRQELMAAVRNADVVGLPSFRQDKKNSNYKLCNYLVRAHGLLRGDTCHCGVHRKLQETGLLADLLNGLNRVTVITCRDVCHGLQERLNISSVKWLWVPPEAQMQEPKERHYPDWHSKTLRELDVGPGDVVLVGAGPNGKVYCDAVKQDGGIGIDLGSVFDGFAGVISRSYIRHNPAAYRL